MGTAITWRNVDAPDTRGALLGMAAAGQSINTGFDKLGEVLKQREQQAEQNWNQQKTNNTQAFLDEIGKYRTPEEYQAALASGQLDQLRQGFGAQIDAPTTRAAEEARLPFLQQRVTTANAFNASQDAEIDRPILDQIAAANANNDPILAAALTAELRRGKGAAMQSIDARQQTLVDRERTATKFGWEGNEEARKAAEAPVHLNVLRAQINSANANADQSRASAEHTRAQAAAEGAGGAKQIEAAYQKAKANSVFSKGDLSTSEGQDNFLDHLKKYADPDEIPTIQGEIGQLMREGVVVTDEKTGKSERIPIPTSMAIEAVMSMGSGGLTGHWGNRVSKRLKENVITNRDKIIADSGALAQFDNYTIGKGASRIGSFPAPEDSGDREERPRPVPAKDPVVDAIDRAAEKAAPKQVEATKERLTSIEARIAELSFKPGELRSKASPERLSELTQLFEQKSELEDRLSTQASAEAWAAYNQEMTARTEKRKAEIAAIRAANEKDNRDRTAAYFAKRLKNQ